MQEAREDVNVQKRGEQQRGACGGRRAEAAAAAARGVAVLAVEPLLLGAHLRGGARLAAREPREGEREQQHRPRGGLELQVLLEVGGVEAVRVVEALPPRRLRQPLRVGEPRVELPRGAAGGGHRRRAIGHRHPGDADDVGVAEQRVVLGAGAARVRDPPRAERRPATLERPRAARVAELEAMQQEMAQLRPRRPNSRGRHRRTPSRPPSTGR